MDEGILVAYVEAMAAEAEKARIAFPRELWFAKL
jgi:hypothetical protein